jgi:hypothetical protein
MAHHPGSQPTDTQQPPVTPALLADVHATLERHGWRLDDNGHTALVCHLWQLANRPGTTARPESGEAHGEAR